MLSNFTKKITAYIGVSRDANGNKKLRWGSTRFRFLIAAALVSSHVNGEASENQGRPGRKAPAGASQKLTAWSRRTSPSTSAAPSSKQAERRHGPGRNLAPTSVARCSDGSRRNPSGCGAASFPLAYDTLGENVPEAALSSFLAPMLPRRKWNGVP